MKSAPCQYWATFDSEVHVLIFFFKFLFSAIFKQKGYEVKELPEDQLIEPPIDCNGDLKVNFSIHLFDKFSIKPCMLIQNVSASRTNRILFLDFIF